MKGNQRCNPGQDGRENVCTGEQWDNVGRETQKQERKQHSRHRTEQMQTPWVRAGNLSSLRKRKEG